MKNIYYALGAVLLVIGILGFVMTDDMGMLLGTFEVNGLHNVVHLFSGALALWAAMKGDAAMKMFGKIFGIVYLLVAVIGFAMDGDIFGLMRTNMADNVLHLVLGLVFVYFGFMAKSATEAPTMQMGA